MDFIEDAEFAGVLSRSDFIGGIDNDALDLEQLDAFIHGHSTSNNQNVQAPHLPESPPDSGSEPPYSPSDLHSLTLPLSNAHASPQNFHNGPSMAGSELTLSQHFLNENGIYLNGNGSSETNNNNNNNNNGGGSDHNGITQENKREQNIMSIPKHEGIVQLPPNAENQFMLHQQGSVTLIELGQNRQFKSDMLDMNVPTRDDSDELISLIPGVYSATQGSQINLRPNSVQCIAGRKRKSSQCNIGQPPATVIKPEPDLNPSITRLIGMKQPASEPDLMNTASMDSNPTVDTDGCPMQSIRFAPFQDHQWFKLCDQNLQELPKPHYRVDADKGFNFSISDDAFVCQKKNHFQITVHAQLHGSAVFVRTNTGLEKIRSFHLHFYGVKLEAPNQTIRIEQSQSDRSKKPFHPVPLAVTWNELKTFDLHDGQISKITVGRLHFSETTNNNMRKKGRPNPEQRYFQLVVGLHAHTHSGNFPIVSQGSERIIVRASNPGQFENDVELCWQRGITPDSIYHSGRVGINTDRPDESLVVHGNIKISGHLVQPSDSRAKQEISELDTSQQLRNVQKIRVVKYRYEPEFALHSGLVEPGERAEDIVDTGVIAQEVQKVLPDAVKEAGSIVLPSGQVIDKFLLVNKDRIFMENIGAVKELCKVTGSLETRIEQLERINARLMRIQKHKRKNCEDDDCQHSKDDFDAEICSNKTIQVIIVILIIITTICLTAISTLYFAEHQPSNRAYSLGFPNFGTTLKDIEATRRSFPPPDFTTTLITKSSKPTKRLQAQKDENEKSDEHNKVTRWPPELADDKNIDISSNSITVPYIKKNETKPYTDIVIVKNKNSFNFKGPGKTKLSGETHVQDIFLDAPHEPDDQVATDEIKLPTGTFNEILIPTVGLPHSCELQKSAQCQSMCCDEHAQGFEKRTCFDEMSPDLKYNVSQSRQEEEPIDIKDVTHLINGGEDNLDAINSSVHVEAPLYPKENDELTQDTGCYTITLMLRANTFNRTLNSRDICTPEQNLAVQSLTIPLSRYMRDSQIEIMFINPDRRLKDWTLCEHKEQIHEYTSALDASGNQIYQPVFQKELTKPSIIIQIPQFGNFERRLEFRTLLKSTTKNVCTLTQDSTGLFIQYNIKLYRECN